MDDKKLKRAAAWVYENRNTGYWTFPILVFDVAHRPGTEMLGLSLDDASSVFLALETKGFLKKQDGETLPFRQIQIQKYKIDFSLSKEFREFAEIPWYYFLPPTCIYYLEKYWAWFVVCFALIVTSFFQGFVGKLGEWIGERLTK